MRDFAAFSTKSSGRFDKSRAVSHWNINVSINLLNNWFAGSMAWQTPNQTECILGIYPSYFTEQNLICLQARVLQKKEAVAHSILHPQLACTTRFKNEDRPA